MDWKTCFCFSSCKFSAYTETFCIISLCLLRMSVLSRYLLFVLQLVFNSPIATYHTENIIESCQKFTEILSIIHCWHINYFLEFINKYMKYIFTVLHSLIRSFKLASMQCVTKKHENRFNSL